MNKVVKYLLAGCLGSLMLTSCFHEDNPPCDSFIRFEYDYNMSYVDLFYKQASVVDLFFFDANGLYQGFIRQSSSGDTFEQGYQMTLPRGLSVGTRFIAWSGLYPESFSYSSLTKGVSTEADLIVALNAAEGAESNKELHALWYGRLSDAKLTYTNEVHTINMVKNTNNIRLVLQSLDPELEVDEADFTFTFTARNNSYDDQNNVADNIDRVYVPFLKENDVASRAAVAELSTLRLLEANDNRLLIRRDGQADAILDVNLNYYINALKLSKYSSMPLQEFMDREDEYHVIIFLSKGTDPGTENVYISSMISINDWIVREQNEN